MMEAEMTEHLGYDEYEHSDSTNSRNGKKFKTIHSKYDKTTIEVPQNRDISFESQIEEWQNRPFASLYPIIFVDAIHFSVRDNGIIKKRLYISF